MHGSRFAGHGLHDDAGVFGEGNSLSARNPAVVEGESRSVVADASSKVGGVTGQTEDGACKAQSRSTSGILAGCVAAAVAVQGTRGEEGKENREADFCPEAWI